MVQRTVAVEVVRIAEVEVRIVVEEAHIVAEAEEPAVGTGTAAAAAVDMLELVQLVLQVQVVK